MQCSYALYRGHLPLHWVSLIASIKRRQHGDEEETKPKLLLFILQSGFDHRFARLFLLVFPVALWREKSEPVRWIR